MTKNEQEKWIKSVLPVAVLACKRFGGYLVSVLVAQMCLEVGYGAGYNCESLVSHWNYIGMKQELLNKTWTSKWWSGEAFPKSTPEWVNDEEIQKDDLFRSYSDLEHCLCDYLQFLRDSKYSNNVYKYRDVLSYDDPYTLISTVAGRGWCTDPSYTPKVMAIIERHNLTQYDKEVKMTKPTSVAEWLGRFGKTLIDRIAINRNKGQLHNVNTHEYLAIHFLGCNGENPDLFNGCYGGTYYVSKAGQCYQAADVGDRLWHVGASSGFKYIHPDARNANTIGIEVATFTASGRNDDNETWYYTEASQISLAQLTAGICLVYGIPLENVLMHGQITTKYCPMPYRRDGGKGSNWTWDTFKARVAEYMGQEAPEEESSTPAASTTILRYGHTGDAVKALQQSLINIGYSCGSSGADGIMGYDTVNAVKNFQEDKGLAVDGLAGPITLEALRNAVYAAAASSETKTVEDKPKYFIQVGAYGSKANAVKMLQKVQAAGFEAFVKDYGSGAAKGTRYHVQCGAYVSRTGAMGLVESLEKAGFKTYIAES